MPGRAPTDPTVYHITHVDNLEGIVAAGRLLCDAQVRAKNAARTGIGYQHIKDRRLRRAVEVGARGHLGDYVPFNFCRRSVMLYVVGQGHEGYRDGQDPILHLVSSVRTVIATGRPWAFTDRHAELGHAIYFDELGQMGEVDWGVMVRKQWGGDSDVKEQRQAEFLVHEWLPWSAIRAVVARTEATASRVRSILHGHGASPTVTVEPGWYYEGLP